MTDSNGLIALPPPERPPRRMPTVPQIAEYWASREQFSIDLEDPCCFACRRRTSSWDGKYFDRAHLINRAWGGLDNAANLVLLCTDCHRTMPGFDPGEEAHAVAWVMERWRLVMLYTLHPDEVSSLIPRLAAYRPAGWEFTIDPNPARLGIGLLS